MKSRIFLAALAGFCFASTGCSVMHFRNGDVKAEGPVMEKWHHNAAYSLMELSPVVDMGGLCKDKEWSMVTTKETFLTAIAGGADDAVTAGLLNGAAVDLWDPQMIEWQCGGAKSGVTVPLAPADSTN